MKSYEIDYKLKGEKEKGEKGSFPFLNSKRIYSGIFVSVIVFLTNK
jgi:hypothetical protein